METTLTRDQLPPHQFDDRYHTGSCEGNNPNTLVTNYGQSELGALTRFKEASDPEVLKVRDFLIKLVEKESDRQGRRKKTKARIQRLPEGSKERKKLLKNLPKNEPDPLVEAAQNNQCIVLNKVSGKLSDLEEGIEALEECFGRTYMRTIILPVETYISEFMIEIAIEEVRTMNVFTSLHHTPLRIVRSYTDNLLLIVTSDTGVAQVPVTVIGQEPEKNEANTLAGISLAPLA